jgi:hypothetical protein
MQAVSRSHARWFYLLVLLAGCLCQPVAANASANANNVPVEDTLNNAVYLPVVKNGAAHLSAPNPLSIEVAVDSSRAMTKTISTEGGMLTATAASGVRFTLTFGPDALLSDEEIVMTPLNAADGMPLSGGLAAGVQLAPDGLLLMHPVTLTIEGAPSPAAGLRSVGFGYEGNGDEFHLRPLVQDGDRSTLQLMHFSGYGVTAGTEAEIQTQATEHAPTAPDDQAAQQEAAGEMDSAAVMRRWFETSIVQDLIAGRGGDLAALEEVISFWPAWVNMVERLELTEELADLIDTGWKHLLLGLANAVDLGAVACKQGDASQVVKLLRWVRIIRLLPAEPRRGWISDDYLNKTMTPMALRCATFEMDFDSTLEQNVPNAPGRGLAHDSHTRAENIRVQFNLRGKLVAPSQATLSYVSFNLSGTTPCTPSKQTNPGTFNLVDARLNLNYKRGSAPGLSVTFDPGRPTERIEHHCSNEVILVFEPQFWTTGFFLMHWAQQGSQTRTITLKSWRFVGSSLYAELIMDMPASPATLYYSGTTWMVLAHTPE